MPANAICRMRGISEQTFYRRNRSSAALRFPAQSASSLVPKFHDPWHIENSVHHPTALFGWVGLFDGKHPEPVHTSA